LGDGIAALQQLTEFPEIEEIAEVIQIRMITGAFDISRRVLHLREILTGGQDFPQSSEYAQIIIDATANLIPIIDEISARIARGEKP
jgi:hypothetical protein